MQVRKICSVYVMNKSVPNWFCNDHTAVNLMPDIFTLLYNSVNTT